VDVPSCCDSTWQVVSAHAGIAVMTLREPTSSTAADMIAEITLE